MAKEISIEVVYALAHEQQLVSMSVPQGTGARQGLILAIRQGLITLTEQDAQLGELKVPLGVYGEIVDDDYTLEDGDRLEIYRPLLQDPKERRRRIAMQASKQKSTR